MRGTPASAQVSLRSKARETAQVAAHPDLAERAETVLGQVLERTTLKSLV